MWIKRVLWVSILVFVISTIIEARGATGIGKTFPTLTIGVTTYTNVAITDVSGGSVFLRHSRGFESLRIDSLDSKTLSELGVEAPAPRSTGKAAGKPSEAASPGGTTAKAHPSIGTGEAAWKQFSGDSVQLEGPFAFLVYGIAAVGVLLLLFGNILFLVAAFQASPWWGVGVLFGGLTCGIVPLIFFFTHLEQCKKSFAFGMSGLFLFMVLGIIVPNFMRAKAAAKAKERAMISCHQAWA